MGPYLVHGARTLSPASPILSVQETRMALFPLRPVLLCQHHELHLDLGSSAVSRALHRLLLPFAWLSRHSYRYMASGHGLPRRREGYVDVHPHLPTLCIINH